MTDSPFTLYKLIVLYALEQVTHPLTNAQLSNLFLDNDYTTYFRLQEVLSDLIETDLLETETRNNTTYYRPSAQGRETIRYFSGDISPEIRSEIKTYLRQHAQELRNDVLITAEYTRTAQQDYSVHCSVQENGSSLIELKLSVPTETAAQTLTGNWKTHSQEAYETLLKLLLS